VKTTGRYALVIARRWPEDRFRAALGFVDTLPEAVTEATRFACAASPVLVVDTEAPGGASRVGVVSGDGLWVVE
jgi:hypothetical protein